MIYLYNIYNRSQYWSPPFNNFLKGLKILFKEKNILCDYLLYSINTPVKNDIIIAISGTINIICYIYLFLMKIYIIK